MPSRTTTEGGRCPHCGRWVPYPLRRCRRRGCPGYARIWAGDQRRKLFANLDAYADQVPAGVKAPSVLLTAVTAPGSSELPWDAWHCRALGEHEHSGNLGCRARSDKVLPWNESAPARWRQLHGEAYRRCRRERLRPWLLTRVWEIQRRGALHVHPVLAYSTLAEKRAADRYVEHLAALRKAFGFGFVERRLRCKEPRAAAAYLSSYFVRGRAGKETLEESVRSRQMPRSIVHVSVLLTAASGVTMRSLRMHRYRYVRRGELIAQLCAAVRRGEEPDAALTAELDGLLPQLPNAP